MTRVLTVILALAALALGGYFYLDRQDPGLVADSALVGPANAEGATEPDTAAIVEMALGAEGAAVTIVEYASFTCPHCRNFHEGPFRKLKAEYIDTGKVRFVYRDVYFDRYGLWASLIARCEPAKFFGVADLIYKGQSEWARGSNPSEIVDGLRKIGRLAGIPDERIETCLQDAGTAQNLVAWYQANATRDGIEGTPTFIVNGSKVENQAWDSFKAIIDAELGG